VIRIADEGAPRPNSEQNLLVEKLAPFGAAQRAKKKSVRRAQSPLHCPHLLDVKRQSSGRCRRAGDDALQISDSPGNL
jgi:hypothetical protein